MKTPKPFRAVVEFYFFAEDKKDAEEAVSAILDGGVGMATCEYDIKKIVRERKPNKHPKVIVLVPDPEPAKDPTPRRVVISDDEPYYQAPKEHFFGRREMRLNPVHIAKNEVYNQLALCGVALFTVDLDAVIVQGTKFCGSCLRLLHLKTRDIEVGKASWAK